MEFWSRAAKGDFGEGKGEDLVHFDGKIQIFAVPIAAPARFVFDNNKLIN